jgi:hypothetical protein
MRPGQQLGEGDRTDRHFVRELRGVNPAAREQDIGVEQDLPKELSPAESVRLLRGLGGA